MLQIRADASVREYVALNSAVIRFEMDAVPLVVLLGRRGWQWRRRSRMECSGFSFCSLLVCLVFVLLVVGRRFVEGLRQFGEVIVVAEVVDFDVAEVEVEAVGEDEGGGVGRAGFGET